MSRADTVKAILALEAFATEANRVAAERRAQLTEEALKELEEQGTAPSWRLPDIARVVLPLSKQKIQVANSDELRTWVEARHPDEIETVSTTRVRPSFVTALLGYLKAADDVVIDPETGEIVPGLVVRKGGEPGSLTITAERNVKEVIASAAADMLGTAHAALLGPVIDAEPEDITEPTFSRDGDPFALFPAVVAR